MRESPVSITTEDGVIDALFFRPPGERPAPAVLLLTDILGLRRAFVGMGDRLAESGFAVLLPNLYYRFGPAPFDPPLSMATDEERARIRGMRESLDRPSIERDGQALLAFLATQPGVAGGRTGVVGYCMSGSMALWLAAAYPDRVVAAASFHGTYLAPADGESPVALASDSGAKLFFGFAEDDPMMPPEDIERLQRILDGADADYRCRVYPGTRHGFAVPGAQAYDQAQSEAHWRDLLAFLHDALD